MAKRGSASLTLTIFFNSFSLPLPGSFSLSPFPLPDSQLNRDSNPVETFHTLRDYLVLNSFSPGGITLRATLKTPCGGPPALFCSSASFPVRGTSENLARSPPSPPSRSFLLTLCSRPASPRFPQNFKNIAIFGLFTFFQSSFPFSGQRTEPVLTLLGRCLPYYPAVPPQSIPFDVNISSHVIPFALKEGRLFFFFPPPPSITSLRHSEPLDPLFRFVNPFIDDRQARSCPEAFNVSL